MQKGNNIDQFNLTVQEHYEVHGDVMACSLDHFCFACLSYLVVFIKKLPFSSFRPTVETDKLDVFFRSK